MADYIGYGDYDSEDTQPSVYRKAGDGKPAVPATSAMLLGVHLDGDPAITSVQWRAGSVNVTTTGDRGRVNLAAAAGAEAITAKATLAAGGTCDIDRPTRLVVATAADEAAYAPPAPVGYAPVTAPPARVGVVLLDDYPGATDDDRLTAALADIEGRTFKPALLFGCRQYTFARAGRVWFSGLSLVGPPGSGDQRTSHDEVGCEVRFTGSGAWWTAKGEVRFPYMESLFFRGNSRAQFFDAGDNIIRKAHFRDLGFAEWKHVLGRPDKKWLNTAVTFSGYWNVNNCYDTAFTLGGSDSNLWTDGMLLDTPPAFSAGMGSNPLLWLHYQSKSRVGPLYITADKVQGVRISGSDNTSGLILDALRVEGRNARTPSLGAVLRIDGGWNTVRDCWLAYATPGTSGSRAGEAGTVVVTGGNTVLSGCFTNRAAGQAASAPWLAVSGGTVTVDRVRDVGAATPVTRVTGSGRLVCDDGSTTAG